MTPANVAQEDQKENHCFTNGVHTIRLPTFRHARLLLCETLKIHTLVLCAQ